MRVCGRCGRPTQIVRKGKDDWFVHTDTLKSHCAPFTRCPVATPSHILADGTFCPDERHTNNG